MGNAGAQKDDSKMRIQIVCSILAEVQNELKEGQKPGDATKVQAIAQKDDIAEHIAQELMQTVANRIIDIQKDKIVDREVSYDEYLGIE